jgi:hypothetical protein
MYNVGHSYLYNIKNISWVVKAKTWHMDMLDLVG